MCRIIPDSFLFLLVTATAVHFQVHAIPYLQQAESELVQSLPNEAQEVPILKQGSEKKNPEDLGVQEDDDDETTSKYGGPGKPQLFTELNQLLKVILTAGQATAQTGQNALNSIRGTKTSNSTSNKAPVKTSNTKSQVAAPAAVPVQPITSAPVPPPAPAPAPVSVQLPSSGLEEEEGEEKTPESSNPDPEINEEEESRGSQTAEEEDGDT